MSRDRAAAACRWTLARLRDEVSAEQVSAELVAALRETLQPSTASVWLREGTR